MAKTTASKKGTKPAAGYGKKRPSPVMPKKSAAKPAAKAAPAPKKAVATKPAPKVAKPVPAAAAKPAPGKSNGAKPVAKAPTSAPAAKPAVAVANTAVPVVAVPKPAPAPPPPPPVEPAPLSTRAPSAVKATATGGALTISAQSSPGAAANGNTHAANILVLVTAGGWPVVDLTKDHFTLMEHFEVPGQQSPLSNNIITFRNAGTGAYLLQTKPINNSPWRSGHHLVQLLVSSPDDRQGQVAVKLLIR